MRTNTVIDPVREWLLIRLDTLSRHRRAASVVLGLIVILALGLAAAHATQGTGRPQADGGAPSHTSTARPGRTVIADAGAVPSPAPVASPLPTPTLGAIAGAGARMRLFPRVAQHDLTLGNLGNLDVHTAKSVVFTPDPHYVAEDTLTDTGPGPPGPLSGLPTRPDLAKRRPVAVVIDNFDPDARPQAGLNRASVVFETVAEGGITRFMAVYLEKDAPIVGAAPVSISTPGPRGCTPSTAMLGGTTMPWPRSPASLPWRTSMGWAAVLRTRTPGISTGAPPIGRHRTTCIPPPTTCAPTPM